MGQCVSKRCCSSSPSIQAQQLPPGAKSPSSSTTFPKHHPKKLEEGECEVGSSVYKSSICSVSPHGGKVRPEPDLLNQISTRRGTVVLTHDLHHLKLIESNKKPSAGDSVVNSSLLNSGASPSSTSSPLRRLHDLKLEKDMLRNRFFSSPDKQVLGPHVNNANPSSPVIVTTSSIPSTIPSPSPANKSGRGQDSYSPQLKPHSFIPRPAAPAYSSQWNGERGSAPTVGKVHSGIPRPYASPTSTREGGHRGQFPKPISTLSSHQRETEKVNCFRVDSSYVVNKGGGSGISGISKIKPERAANLPNRPASNLTNQVTAVEKKSTPLRTCYPPYKSNGQRLAGGNKYLVKKPEVSKPFYTILYQGPPRKVDSQGTATNIVEDKTKTKHEDRKGDTLVLRSVTWTKEPEVTVRPIPLIQAEPLPAVSGEALVATKSTPQIDKSTKMEIPSSSTSTKPFSSFTTKSSVPQPKEFQASTRDRVDQPSSTPSNTCPLSDQESSVSDCIGGTGTSLSAASIVSTSTKLSEERSCQLIYPSNPLPHRLSTEKLFHSSTTSSVLSSNDNNELSSDSDYLIDDEIEDQPDLITTTTTLKTDNNSSLLLASNLGSSLESLQIESDYSEDDQLEKDTRSTLSGLLAKEAEESDSSVIRATKGIYQSKSLDKIEVISLHSDDTSNTCEKVDDVKSQVLYPVGSRASALSLNTGLKSDTKTKKRSSVGSRGTPSNKMVLDRTMNYELRSSHRSVSLKHVELPKNQKCQGNKNGALQVIESGKSTEDLLEEVQDLKRTLFQLKTVLEEQNRREKEKDEVINNLLKEVDTLKKIGDCEKSTKDSFTQDVLEKEVGGGDTLLPVRLSERRLSHNSISSSVINKS